MRLKGRCQHVESASGSGVQHWEQTQSKRKAWPRGAGYQSPVLKFSMPTAIYVQPSKIYSCSAIMGSDFSPPLYTGNHAELLDPQLMLSGQHPV